MSSHPPHARSAPLGYVGRGGRYDDCVDAAGHLRETWARFFGLLGPNPAAALRAATEACHRAIIEQDVSMNVYRGERADAQPWPLDPLPLLVGADEWAGLTLGLRQRAHLFNELMRDLYGEQRLVRQGHVPAALAMANPHFLRACAGLGRADRVLLHTYAADVARSPDGRWWVVEDRLDAPSGLGYSLQNRIITRQALPDVFHRAPVQRLYQFFRHYRSSLESLGPGKEEPRIVLLSPGPANETYHEHAYLSRYLGYTLVEGEDLTTRDRQLFLRTVGGLKRIDTVLRRVDSDYCDPLELEPDSLLGVPGLVNAVHAGEVAVANALGARALETPALLAFLQPLCREVLGEELLLPSAATWWCGQEGPRSYVLDHLPELVIKPAFRTQTSESTRYGAWLSRSARQALLERIRAEPWAWCGQERILPGTTPGWHENALRPMPFITRIYVAWHDGDYVAMPGGLTRCNPNGKDLIASLQLGSVSKDTWVLHAGEPTTAPAFVASRPGETLRHPAATPSRMASNLFWLGRYLERSSQLALKLGKIDALLHDEIALLDPGVPEDALQAVFQAQDATRPRELPLAEQARAARRIAENPAHPSSLVGSLQRLIRLLDQLKVNLPHDGWQLLRQLRNRKVAADGAACTWLHQQLAALESLTNDGMPRDVGWRFLDLGRRLERGLLLFQLLEIFLAPARAAAPTEFRFQSVLHLASSLFTYRGLYHGPIDAAGTIDWLLLSAENPRGFRFQAEKINQHLGFLPGEVAPEATDALRSLAFRLHSDVRLADARRLAEEPGRAVATVRDLRAGLNEMSERLTAIYLSHAAQR